MVKLTPLAKITREFTTQTIRKPSVRKQALTASKYPKPYSIEFEEKLITPYWAKVYLNDMQKNRPVKMGPVGTYSKEMLAGTWHYTHQGIAFDPDGWLIDGQHRLLAIVKSGIPQWMCVFYNVPADSFDKLDKGAARSIADTVAIAFNPRYRSRLACTARVILAGPDSKESVPDAEVINFIGQHYELLVDYISMLNKGVLRGFYNGGVSACFVTAAILNGREKVDEAIRRIRELDWVGKNDPLKALYLALVKGNGKKAIANPTSLRYWICTAGLKSYLKGRTLKTLRLSVDKLVYLPGAEDLILKS